MGSLTGKTALVTGAGSGIGAAIAERFARSGAHVIVTDVNGPQAAGTEQRLRAAGGLAEAFQLDVTSEDDARRAADTVHARHRRLDILVNNAGVGHVGAMPQTSGADLDRLYAINVRGVFNVTKAFLPAMIARRAGVIVNIASIAGIVGLRDRLAYCTTKFAVVGMTKSLALDHALEGIRVNCICPGRVETPFVTARLREYPDPAQAYRDMAASQAVGRMGRPEEIAAAAEYLAGDDAAFVTGSALIIDGGLSAGK
jgi:NAD(P)-dependent dehydrogenase (short-subunit alcohol dehydrogenase family)